MNAHYFLNVCYISYCEWFLNDFEIEDLSQEVIMELNDLLLLPF